MLDSNVLHFLFPFFFFCRPTGRDFSHDETLDVPTQVELLIKQATSHENLCQCYIGWSVPICIKWCYILIQNLSIFDNCFFFVLNFASSGVHFGEWRPPAEERSPEEQSKTPENVFLFFFLSAFAELSGFPVTCCKIYKVLYELWFYLMTLLLYSPYIRNTFIPV